jgi:general secretion pathway protein K
MRPALRHQRGVAIVTALLLTTLAVTIVGSLFWQQQVQVRSIENQRLQLQKQWILRGALDWTRLILREDGRHSTADHLGEPWAVPLAETRLDQYVDNPRADPEAADAVLSGSIVDAQSRFNLTNLATDGVVNPIEVAVLRRLLVNLQQNGTLAQAAAELVAGGQRRVGLAAAGSTRMGVEHVDDLLAAPGFTPEALERLREFVVVLPGMRRINVNTAAPEVLAARIDTLSMSDAAALVAARERAWFTNESDFVTRMQGKALSSGTGQVSVSTGYFLVNGHVRMSRAEMDMQALIERSGTVTRLLWIREF